MGPPLLYFHPFDKNIIRILIKDIDKKLLFKYILT